MILEVQGSTVGPVSFGKVRIASGVKNFFGRGYPFHEYGPMKRWLAPLDDLGFTSKTTTIAARKGNLPLGGDPPVTPRELIPRCIKVYPLRGGGMVLNAVGLSGPGAASLFQTGEWQRRMKPFMISFMAVGATRDERDEERWRFFKLLAEHLPSFRAPVGIQENHSCPNAGPKSWERSDDSAQDDFVAECHMAREIFAPLRIPQQVKLCMTTSPVTAARIAEHPSCHALAVSNAVPFGLLPDLIPWQKFFGTTDPKASPLAKFGSGGGLSGAPLLGPLLAWFLEARPLITKPIEVGGGILSPIAAEILIWSGADAISLGTVALLRPWRIAEIVAAAEKAFAVRRRSR